MCTVLDVIKFLREGHELFLSDNGVAMAYTEVKPQYWHTVVMGRGSNPMTMISPLRGLGGREECWNHYLVNEHNWLKYYQETVCQRSPCIGQR